MPPRKKPAATPPSGPTSSPAPKAAPSAPPKAAKRVPLNVAVERKLIDSKIIIPEEPTSTRFLKIVSYAIIFGGLAGACLIVYLRISQFGPEAPVSIPRISIPQSAAPEDTTPPAGGTTTEEEQEAPLEPTRIVEILDTPTGFLNVRKGPATSFAKITEVKPGDAHILVSTDTASGWHEIRLADGSTGWITSQYASVK
ncbi:hypothetical protein A2671_02030 [Candidatus Kaiserbacteria bacterium RIFCSPHIGHO2_01_FULL_49_13]|uniref:SH3b domain-containing protein n=1 Tax=Candidatus Kaiserbacteria bacterium RIFCSPHIGHO2_01_FULL_49_13 TaxID=1798477 RepID=A0A1F6CF85_9BACT|nr:MAG: hypothetical protein A2671_02030 [Candidatus Kaiserbacteria bacterium RIFCSPHIGHO2_01_FULL_49_13]